MLNNEEKKKRNNGEKFSVFDNKIKTRMYIQNLRHCSLYLYVINSWLKLYRNVCGGNGNIEVKRIIAKKCFRNSFFLKFEFCKCIFVMPYYRANNYL